jgi:hypothetical protein
LDFLTATLVNGMQWPLMGLGHRTLGGQIEQVDYNFESFVWRAYMSDPIVFAVEMARINLFTEARFQFQNMRGGRPGDYWGDRDRRDSRLEVLDHPWPGGTTGDLLKYMLIDHDFGGNAFVARLDSNPDRLVRLRPDWTTMVHGSANPEANMWDPGVELLGIGYQPGGFSGGSDPIFIQADQVAHFSATPDPLMPLRGMAWITPVVRDIMGDQAMTEHRLKFFEQGATPSMIIKTTLTDVKKAKEWADWWRQEHEGSVNAYRTAFLSAGSDATVVGADLSSIDFKSVQGGAETRIAAAAQVPPVVAGLSEGLQGSSLNSGNFEASMRRFADLTMRTLWRNVSGSLERIVPPPSGTRLWYDDRDIPALRSDVKSIAEVMGLNATAIRTLTDGGYEPQSVLDAVNAYDVKRLKHTGKLSVQLQDPNAPEPEPAVPPELVPPAEVQEPGRSELLDYLLQRRLGEPDYLFTRYSPDQPRVPAGGPDGGQFGFAGGAPGLHYTGLAEAAREGGFSVTTHGDVPQGGFMVSPYPDAEQQYDARTMTRQDVHAYRDAHAKQLAQPNHYLGGWRDGDRVYLDISVHASSATAAERYAVEHHQLAYFDLGSGQTVYVQAA